MSGHDGGNSAVEATVFACRRIKLLCVRGRPVAWALGFNCPYCRRLHVHRLGLDDAINIPHYPKAHCSSESPYKDRGYGIIVYGLPDCLDLPAEGGHFPISDRRGSLRPAGVRVPESTLRNWIMQGIGGHRLVAIRTRQGLFTSERWLDEFLCATGRYGRPEEPPLTGREEVAQMIRESQERGLENVETTIESCEHATVQRSAAV